MGKLLKFTKSVHFEVKTDEITFKSTEHTHKNLIALPLGFCAQINQPLWKSICATNFRRNIGKKQHRNDERNVDEIRWNFEISGLLST
jgi:hypothetical protein